MLSKSHPSRSLSQHKEFLKADLARLSHKPGALDYLLKNEQFFVWRFIYHLRCVEYYCGKGFLYCFPFAWHWYRYKHYCWKNKWTIRPFTLGPGALGLHIGDFVHISEGVTVGRNFTFSPGVVCTWGGQIQIGDNCTLYPGVKIVKSVNIGNNVIIGANSIVTHDIPDNAIAVGIPAKIIKYNNIG